MYLYNSSIIILQKADIYISFFIFLAYKEFNSFYFCKNAYKYNIKYIVLTKK